MAKVSVLERIKELEAEKEKLMSEAKAQALAAATAAIEELNALGFNYRLTQGDAPARTQRQPVQSGTRRSGIRESVLDAITSAGPDGIAPAGIRAKLGIADDDKSGAQSVANALSNLKKTAKIADKNGAYVAA